MKYKHWQNEGALPAELDGNANNLYSRAYFGGKYYHAISTAAVAALVKVYEQDTPAGAATLRCSAGVTANNVCNSPVLKVIGTRMYLGFALYTSADTSIRVYVYYTDNGTVWTAPAEIDTLVSVIPNYELYTTGDFFKLGSEVYFMLHDGENDLVRMYKLSDSSVDTGACESASSGYVRNDIYYFATHGYVASYDGTTVTITTTELAGMSETSPSSDYYYSSGYGLLLLISATQFIMYHKIKTQWIILASGTKSCVLWDSNGFPAFVISNGTIYYCKTAGAIVKMVTIGSYECTAGVNNTFVLDDGVNDYAYSIYNKSILTRNGQSRMGRDIDDRAQFENESESWDTDDYKLFYDDSDNEIFEGFIDDVVDNRLVKLVSPVEEELKYKPGIGSIAGVVSTLIDNVYTSYCMYLSKTSTAATTTPRVFVWNNVSLDDFFRWAERVEAKLWRYTVTFACTYSATGGSSALTYTHGDGKIFGLTPLTKTYKISKVTLYGNGIKAEAVSTTVINGQTVTDYYPNINSQTELQTLANNFLTANAKTIVAVECDIRETTLGILPFGTYVEITYSPESIATTSFYIVNSGYDWDNGYCHILGTDVVIYALESIQKPLMTNVQFVPTEMVNQTNGKNTNFSLSDVGHFRGTESGELLYGETETGWNKSNVTTSFETKLAHYKMCKLVGSAAGSLQYDKELSFTTDFVIEFWFVFNQTNKYMQIDVVNDSSGALASIYIVNDGTIHLYHDSTDHGAIQTYAAGTLYHFKYHFVAASKIEFWINDVYYTKALTANFTPTRFRIREVNASQEGIYWFGSFATSIESNYFPFMGYYDGQVNCAQLFTADGRVGWHSFENFNRSAWSWWGNSATNNATLDLTLYTTWASAETNVTQTGENACCIPSTAKRVKVRVSMYADDVSATNAIIVKKYGNGDYDGFRQFLPATANYWIEFEHKVSLSTDGKIRFLIGWGAGTIYFYIMIMGYEI